MRSEETVGLRKCMAEYLFPKISLQQVQFITKFAVPIFGRGPLSHQTNWSKRQKKGRPTDKSRQEAFLEVAKYLKENEDEQITVNDLMNKMAEFNDQEPYSARYMKEKLKENFGVNIVIASTNGKADVETFRSTASTILQNFYDASRDADPEADKIRVIKPAADLIKKDIKSKDISKSFYPGITWRDFVFG